MTDRYIMPRGRTAPFPVVMPVRQHRSVLIVNEGLRFYFFQEWPKWFWRFFQWLLLGWKWERVK